MCQVPAAHSRPDHLNRLHFGASARRLSTTGPRALIILKLGAAPSLACCVNAPAMHSSLSVHVWPLGAGLGICQQESTPGRP